MPYTDDEDEATLMSTQLKNYSKPTLRRLTEAFKALPMDAAEAELLTDTLVTQLVEAFKAGESEGRKQASKAAGDKNSSGQVQASKPPASSGQDFASRLMPAAVQKTYHDEFKFMEEEELLSLVNAALVVMAFTHQGMEARSTEVLLQKVPAVMVEKLLEALQAQGYRSSLRITSGVGTSKSPENEEYYSRCILTISNPQR